MKSNVIASPGGAKQSAFQKQIAEPVPRPEIASAASQPRNDGRGISGGLLAMTALLFATTVLSGCGSDWEKKLIRRRAKPPRPPQFQLETVQRPYPQLYGEHFHFWRNIHRQLVQDLGTNHKRELQDLREARRHLAALEKYLQEAKAKEVREYLERFDRLTKRLREDRLAETDQGVLERELESLEIRISRRLHPKKVKDSFLPTPLPLDLEPYQGEEPIAPQPIVIKADPAAADRGKDESDSLTYEKFRTFSVQ